MKIKVVHSDIKQWSQVVTMSILTLKKKSVTKPVHKISDVMYVYRFPLLEHFFFFFFFFFRNKGFKIGDAKFHPN